MTNHYNAFVNPSELLQFAQSLVKRIEQQDIDTDQFGNVVIAIYDDGINDENRISSLTLSTRHLTRTGWYDVVNLVTFDPDQI